MTSPSANIDVAICVHDALDHVVPCVRSVIDAGGYHHLRVIDDGSAQETRGWLGGLSGEAGLQIARNNVALGYTRAANQAIRASDADILVLLNSDTRVPTDWLARLVEVFELHPKTGLVGPVSNAATWQSVPRRFDSSKRWADNSSVEASDAAVLDALVAQLSLRQFPTVPLLNGFCLAIRRSVIDAIGGFDERHFPRGYGEENDYCLRALAAGFEARVADHLFVYHAKSKSYGKPRRAWLRWRGGRALHRLHGADVIAAHAAALRDEPALAHLRTQIGEALDCGLPH